LDKKNSEISSLSFKIQDDKMLNMLSTDEKRNINNIDLEKEIEIELSETPIIEIFNQESLAITKLKYERKDDFGMIELTKEQLEEQEREELELKALENIEKQIKQENDE